MRLRTSRRATPSRPSTPLIATAALALLVASCASSTSQTGTPTASAVPSPSPTNISTVSRYASGIPKTFDGHPVYLGIGAALHARATTDSTPFLVGGWFGDGTFLICSGGLNRDPSPLVNACTGTAGGDAPAGAIGSTVSSIDGGAIYWNGHTLANNQGPAIVRVHTHDPLAASCRPENLATCEFVLVVDAVLWTGDTWTRTAPLTAPETIRRLETINILEDVPIGSNAVEAVQRSVFPTPHPADCPAPWPHQVYDLHGDPRFGLVAIFPDVAAREAAQAATPRASGCLPDARIVRPGPAQWVGAANVLVLSYGSEMANAVRTVLTSTAFPGPTVPFPPASLDESYRVVLDYEAAREASYVDTRIVLPIGGVTSGEPDAEQRYLANGLSFTIGPGEVATSSNVAGTVWAQLQKGAVPGTARIYTVDHPSSTDPALRRERLIAFELLHPGTDSWALVPVSAGS